MSGLPGYNPFGGTSVNIFSPGADAANDVNSYEAWMKAYKRRMGIYDPADFAEQATAPAPTEDPAKIQKMLYEYLAVVWGISQEQFDCGFAEYKKQLQAQEEKKKLEVEEFVRQRMYGESPKASVAPQETAPEAPQKTPQDNVAVKQSAGGKK